MDPKLKAIGCNCDRRLLAAYLEYCHQRGLTMGGEIERLIAGELAMAGRMIDGFVPQEQNFYMAKVRKPPAKEELKVTARSRKNKSAPLRTRSCASLRVAEVPNV